MSPLAYVGAVAFVLLVLWLTARPRRVYPLTGQDIPSVAELQRQRAWRTDQRARVEADLKYEHLSAGYRLAPERVGEPVANRTGKRSRESWERDLITRLQGGKISD